MLGLATSAPVRKTDELRVDLLGGVMRAAGAPLRVRVRGILGDEKTVYSAAL